MTVKADPEMVVPIEDLADPMPIRFAFKATNIDVITIYVQSDLFNPPAGWAGAAENHGSLGVGVDDYFLNDNCTRTKPANLTEETVTLRIRYYNDAGYANLIKTETVDVTITYVDFNDAGFTVVDTDTFEVDLEGWAKTDEVGASTAVRSTVKSRSGVASMLHGSLDTNDVSRVTKSFVIGNVTRAFIRVWVQFSIAATVEIVLELITDAGGAGQRTATVAMDGTPLGGASIASVWLCVGLKIPVNGSKEVRLRLSVESAVTTAVFYDDIKVVQS
jgi:hypothetical protein